MASPTASGWRSTRPRSTGAACADRFPYLIRQDAGDANALGRIKFIMPKARTSSCTTRPTGGCSAGRTAPSPPAASAWRGRWNCWTWCCRALPGWDRARGAAGPGSRQTTGGVGGAALPVRLHYTTVVVERGRGALRPDIYGLDEAYARAMDRPARIAGSGRVARPAGGRPAGAGCAPRPRLPLLRRGGPARPARGLLRAALGLRRWPGLRCRPAARWPRPSAGGPRSLA